VISRRRFTAGVCGVILVVCASLTRPAATRGRADLTDDLNRIFDDPVVARALVGVRVESLARPGVVYERNPSSLVMPASNMKLFTLAAAAERLGWDFKFETRLETAGTIADGVLTGDLVVVGGGDPSIASQDFGPSPLFGEWASALAQAGIRRVEGRIIGDDHVFDQATLGAGWAWDYLADGYAAPVGGLSYNENEAVVRIWPGEAPGDPVRVELSPPGHLLGVANAIKTGDAKAETTIAFARLPGSARLTISGTVPAGAKVITRTAAVDNPTRFFVEGLRLALADRGIRVTGGASDLDDVADPPPVSGRRLIARRESLPLSALSGYWLKVSQNFYAETLFKTLGRAPGQPGSAEGGRRAVRDVLTAWGIPPDSYVMYDGSGLSRYNYVTAAGIVTLLRHVWEDQRLRGPFVAAMPVAGHDGTLSSRMKNTVLDANVEAKTGTISNVRSLSGFLETAAHEKLVFSMIVNHFTADSVQVDAVVEKALVRLVQGVPGGS
jgi:D-alanyl-D-alanine carboxypeptidase/D-alanyl-D-alanine-endopeptidase (penicillin-binding protein 4)